jgi:ketosteroid isomerase-like protein
MHSNARLIQNFYEAFQRRDSTGMDCCYLPEAEFSDPVFTSLKGPQVPAMWAMLTERAKSLEVSFSGVVADDHTGQARWEARYPFTKTGRLVHNIIEARFAFRDGKIIRHSDSFDLWRWAGMALGPKGRLLGWLPAVQSAIRREAMSNLERYMQTHKQY